MAEIQPPKKKKSLRVVLESYTSRSPSPTNHADTNDKPNPSETLDGKTNLVVTSSIETSKKTQKRKKKLPTKDNKEQLVSNSTAINKKVSNSTSASLKKTSVKSDKPKPLINSNICRFCGKFYATATELKEHEINHTVNKELLCPQCGMGFARRSYLVEHACIHNGEKPHKCYYCDRAFTLRCNLVRHVRIHTGEKPFVCDICEKDFTLKKNMIEHKRTHTGEKPFDCKLCDQSFSRRSSLVRHLRIHTGEKCYECNECHKKFSWKYYLQRHMAIHSQSKTRKHRRRRNNKDKGEVVSPQPVQTQTDFVNCEDDNSGNHIQENFTEVKPPDKFVEHSYAMESNPIDESSLKIKEEFGRNEEIELKEESYEYQENGLVEPELPLSKEKKQPSLVVAPIIISAYSSKAEIPMPQPPQINPIVSPSSDVIHFKMTRNEFDSFCGRRLHVKLHRLEDIPFEMQEE